MHIEKAIALKKKKKSDLSFLFRKNPETHMAGKYQPQLYTLSINMFKGLLVLKTEVIKFLKAIISSLCVIFMFCYN